MTWIPIRIESEFDREKLVSVLARNGYEVRQSKQKVKNRTEHYVEYREREDAADGV